MVWSCSCVFEATFVSGCDVGVMRIVSSCRRSSAQQRAAEPFHAPGIKLPE